MVARTAVTGGRVTHTLQGRMVTVRNQEQKNHAGLSFTTLSDMELRKTKIYRAGERERETHCRG